MMEMRQSSKYNPKEASVVSEEEAGEGGRAAAPVLNSEAE